MRGDPSKSWTRRPGFWQCTIAAVVAIAVACTAVVWLKAAPAAPVVTFVSIEGEKITTADLRGQVVLVNFWATDCVVCVREMPQIVATYNKFHARGFATIAVAMRHDPPHHVLAYVAKNQLPFKVALDPLGALAQAFGNVRLTPTTFIIDRQGRIIQRIVGEPDFAKLHALLEKQLQGI